MCANSALVPVLNLPSAFGSRPSLGRRNLRLSVRMPQRQVACQAPLARGPDRRRALLARASLSRRARSGDSWATTLRQAR